MAHTHPDIKCRYTLSKKRGGGWKGKTVYTIWVISVQKSYVPNAGIRGWGSAVPSSYLQGLNIFTVLMTQCLKLLGFFPPTQNDPTSEACISPFTRQRKKKRKICDLFNAGLFMSFFFFFLTLFKPKPCVRCDFHVVIIFMAPMSYAASLHQTSFWTLRAPQLGVEQSCA